MPTKKTPKPKFRIVPALSTPSAPARLEDGELEAIVKTAVQAAPASHAFGGRKVFIHRVYEGAKMVSPAIAAMSLDDFKRRLVALQRSSRWLELARADFPAAMNADDVANSMTLADGSTYNFVVRK